MSDTVYEIVINDPISEVRGVNHIHLYNTGTIELAKRSFVKQVAKYIKKTGWLEEIGADFFMEEPSNLIFKFQEWQEHNWRVGLRFKSNMKLYYNTKWHYDKEQHCYMKAECDCDCDCDCHSDFEPRPAKKERFYENDYEKIGDMEVWKAAWFAEEIGDALIELEPKYDEIRKSMFEDDAYDDDPWRA
jgi:hypothetical protein